MVCCCVEGVKRKNCRGETFEKKKKKDNENKSSSFGKKKEKNLKGPVQEHNGEPDSCSGGK